MSLFGMDPNVIQQNRVQSGVDNASRMSADYAIGAAGGQMLGAGLNSAFGLQTPDMAQAASVQSGLAGQNLNTVAGLRAAAQQLMMNGDYAQAMALHAQARDLEADDINSTNLQQDRALGESSNVIVKRGIAADPKDALGVATPAVQHSIIKHVNGRVVDVTQGREFATEAEWIDSILKLYGPETANALKTPPAPNAKAVLQAIKDGGQLPDGSTVSAADLILGPKPQTVLDAEVLKEELQAGDVAQTAHEDNVTLYESMFPTQKTSPAGLELKTKIDSFQASMDSEGMSDAEFEAGRAEQKRQEQYSAELKRYDDQINNLKMQYAAMPQISKGSQQGMLISKMLLDAIQEKDLFLQSNPQG